MFDAMTLPAGLIVLVSGVWLIVLAIMSVARPETVKSFFAKFASSSFAHFLEMFVRLIVGAAFVIYADKMKFPIIFTSFGWLLIVTTAVLTFVPWKLHNKFAERSLPMLYRWMPFFSLVSFLGGSFIFYTYFAAV
ncbi:MAG TPA: hypothetical protein PKA82_11050 [Pyrinomonadaceae bacterium]|nr:hypothetical protein [Pyrinomonadaceae bacterium]